MRKKDLNRLLEERQQRVELLAKRVESAESLLETYRKREQSVVDAMAAARTSADQLIGEAAKRAEEMVRAAHQQAEELLAKARAESEALLSGARAESETLKKRTEISLAEYQETVNAYNRLIEDSAAEVIRSTNRYAALLKSRKLTPAEEYVTRSEPEAPRLQDATDNPAKLMQNIYELQNRDIPEIHEIPGLFGREAHPIPEGADAQPSCDEEDVARPIELPFLSDKTEGVPAPSQAPAEEQALPRVQQFVAENAGENGLSLDDLLDEIIEAGDQ